MKFKLKKGLTFISLFLALFISFGVLSNRQNTLKVIHVGDFTSPKICHNVTVVDDNNIVILGGYNNFSDSDSNYAEIFNLEKQNSSNLFKSNFNNKYGNYAFVHALCNSKNNEGTICNNKKSIINIQPIKLKQDDKYGIEIYNFDTRKLSLIQTVLIPRGGKESPVYYKSEDNIYISGGYQFNNNVYVSKFENVSLDNYKIKIIETFGIEKAGIYSGILFGGIYNSMPQLQAISLKTKKTIATLHSQVLNPKLYFLEYHLLAVDGPEIIVVDTTNPENPDIQRIILSDLPAIYERVSLPVQIPKILNKYAIESAIQADDYNILFVFNKNGKRYIAKYFVGGGKLEILGYYKSAYKFPKYVYINQKLYIIGGAAGLNDTFKCGDEIPEDADVSNSIYEILIN